MGRAVNAGIAICLTCSIIAMNSSHFPSHPDLQADGRIAIEPVMVAGLSAASGSTNTTSSTMTSSTTTSSTTTTLFPW